MSSNKSPSSSPPLASVTFSNNKNKHNNKHNKDRDGSKGGELVSKLLKYDVLLGPKVMVVNNNQGNLLLHQLVLDLSPRYAACTRRADKHAIAKEIVTAVWKQGGRFLQSLRDQEQEAAVSAVAAATHRRVVLPSETNPWFVVTDQLALIRKVKLLLRSACQAPPEGVQSCNNNNNNNKPNLETSAVDPKKEAHIETLACAALSTSSSPEELVSNRETYESMLLKEHHRVDAAPLDEQGDDNNNNNTDVQDLLVYLALAANNRQNAILEQALLEQQQRMERERLEQQQRLAFLQQQIAMQQSLRFAAPSEWSARQQIQEQIQLEQLRQQHLGRLTAAEANAMGGGGFPASLRQQAVLQQQQQQQQNAQEQLLAAQILEQARLAQLAAAATAPSFVAPPPPPDVRPTAQEHIIAQALEQARLAQILDMLRQN